MLSRDPMLFVTPWIVVHQAPLSVGLSRQEYWSGFSPGDLPDPGIELTLPPSRLLQADFFFFTTEKSGKPLMRVGPCGGVSGSVM